jgi:L,D-transpeptidase YcbB
LGQDIRVYELAQQSVERGICEVKRVNDGIGLSGKLGMALLATALVSQPALAQNAGAQNTGASAGPIDLTKQAKPAPVPAPSVAVPQGPATAVAAAPLAPEAAPHWTPADAQALLATIKGIGAEGLFAKDYQPDALAAAIAKGEGSELDETATRLFTWLA